MNDSMNENDLAELQISLRRYCLFLTANQWDAEDLTQEAWVRLLRRLKAGQHANPQALLLRIAKHTWIDLTRKQKLQRRYLEREKSNLRLTYENEPNIGQLEQMFQAILKHMTPLQRAVFLLKDVYDYSIHEIAQKLNTSQGAVKAALHRARHATQQVKHELVRDSLILPQEEGFKVLVRSLATAYQLGDAATVLALALEGEVDVTTAIAIAHNQLQQTKMPANNITISQYMAA